MSTDYKPGTVAEVTVRPRKKGASGGADYLAFWDGYHERWITSDEGALDPPSNYWEHDVRPLIVLDPDTIDTPSEIREHLSTVKHLSEPGWLSRFVDQIEAQTKPPRIPEPGLWGVVEATGATLPRRRWIHHEEDRWVCDTGVWRYWRDLIDPVLVREGIES